jgi:large subunit ribosomal protein L25
MKTSFELVAELRDDQGKGASRRLRRSGKVPAILYGGHEEPRALALDHTKLMQMLDNERFYSTLLSLKMGTEKQAAVLKDLQRHPYKNQVVHIDFQRVREDEKIRMRVPLHFINEETAPGVKAGGTSSHNMTEVEISCLPADLPEYIEVDCGGLGIGDSIHLSEISLPKGVEIPALALGEDHDSAVVTILASRASKSDEGEEGGEAVEGGEEAASED